MSILVSWNILFIAPYVCFFIGLTFIFSCFTTEILDGFDVQRTTGFADTQKRYVDLTRSVIAYYDASFSIVGKASPVCPTYDDFKRKCYDLKKKTVSDIFGCQLMQVTRFIRCRSLIANVSQMNINTMCRYHK
jgi:hypothetical protein